MDYADITTVSRHIETVKRFARESREADAFFRDAPRRLRQLAANPPKASGETLVAAGVVTGLAIASIAFGGVALAKRYSARRSNWSDQVAAEKAAKPQGQQL